MSGRLSFGKIGFVHRYLWGRNRLYQMSILTGPASLAGGLAALVIWVASHGGFSEHRTLPAWATPDSNGLWKSINGAPLVLKPSQPLPLIDAEGKFAGYKSGWRLTTQPIDLNAGFDVNVESALLTASTFVGATIEMGRILQEAPKVPLYAGTGQAFLAAKTAGVYTLSARFDRPPAEPADCLMRLGFGTHRIFADVELSNINETSKTLEAVRFDLEPGLYTIAWAFSCWHNQAVTAPGSLTFLIGHPDEPTPRPVLPDEIVHREAAAPLH